MSGSRTQRPVKFSNGMSLHILGDGETFLGIGAVEFQATALRSDALPWTVYAQSDTGFQFTDFRLVRVEATDARTTIHFEAPGRWLPRITAMDAMGEARTRARRLHPPVAKFRWSFAPIVEKIWENTWSGLAMRIEYECPGHPIHWLIEEATWELDARADGCTLIQQDLSAMPLEQRVRADSAFSTAEIFRLADGTESIPMDMQPRGGGAAICDFQTKGDMALCLLAERPSLTRARLEKFADEDVIHYTDQPFFPLSERASAPQRKLLVYRHPEALSRHEWRNLWLDCFTETRRLLHESYGMKLEIPRPTIVAHLWDAELKKYGPGWTARLAESLPALRRLGFTDLFTHGPWESVCSDPQRRAGEGNICCPYAFRYAEQFGGKAGMKQLIDAAHAQGLRVFQWFGFQLSSFAPLWKEHPDWVVREASGDPWDAAYQTNWCVQMRSGYRQIILEQIRQVRADTGLDGIFWDSYHNLGVDCVDWKAPDRAPQAEEIWALQAEVQRLGYAQRCESVTIFGVTTVAMFGLEAGGFRRRLWQDAVKNDEAFAMLDCGSGFFCDGSAFRSDRLSPRDYFWLAGHRAIPQMDFHPWPDGGAGGGRDLPGGPLAEEYARTRHFYNATLERMVRLRTTPGGKYALWLDAGNRPAVIWVFENCEVDHTGQATNLASQETVEVKGTLAAKAGDVYVLSAGKPRGREPAAGES